MGPSYRPTNPFRRYRQGNPFADAAPAPALPAVTPPEPLAADATAVDPLARERRTREAIEANLAAAREQARDTAPLSEAERLAAVRRNVSPLTAGVAEGARTLGGGTAQVLAGGERTALGRRIRRLRERSEAADVEAREGEPGWAGLVRGGARMATETAPLLAFGTPANPLAGGSLLQRGVGEALAQGTGFAGYEAGMSALDPRPTLEGAAERIQGGGGAGLAFGAGGVALPAGFRALRAMGERGGAAGVRPAPSAPRPRISGDEAFAAAMRRREAEAARSVTERLAAEQEAAIGAAPPRPAQPTPARMAQIEAETAARPPVGAEVPSEVVDDLAARRVRMPRDLQRDINFEADVRAMTDREFPVGSMVETRYGRGVVIPRNDPRLGRERAPTAVVPVALTDGSGVVYHSADLAPSRVVPPTPRDPAAARDVFDLPPFAADEAPAIRARRRALLDEAEAATDAARIAETGVADDITMRQRGFSRRDTRELNAMLGDLETAPPVRGGDRLPAPQPRRSVAEIDADLQATADRQARATRPAAERSAPGELPDDFFTTPAPPSGAARRTRPRDLTKWTDDELTARYLELNDRIGRSGAEFNEGFKPWTRFDDDVFEQRSGTVLTNQAGRAIAATNRDAAQLQRLTAEADRRGIDLMARGDELAYDRAMADARAAGEMGGAHPAVLRGLAGAGVGGTVGATQGDTPEERLRNAALSASALGLLAAGIPAIRGRDGKLQLWHGTPHTFEPEPGHPLGRFRMDKIGTGEGAQAYGHGLYLAQSEATGRAYRDALGRDVLMVDGVPAATEDRAAYAATNAVAMHGVDETIRLGRRAISGSAGKFSGVGDTQGLSPEWWRRFVTTAESLRGKRVEVVNTGRLYRAEVDAEDVDFLDWDRPLSEQSPKVREAVAQWMDEYRASEGANGGPYIGPDATGAQIYRELAARQPNRGKPPVAAKPGESYESWAARRPSFAEPSPAEATRVLRGSGIKGIRYADGTSRAANAQAANLERRLAEGQRTGEYEGATRAELLDELDRLRGQVSYNYVLFTDEPIRITERGAASPAVVSALGGAGAGATVGAASGASPEERRRNALLLAGAGLAGGIVAGRALTRRLKRLPAADAEVRAAREVKGRPEPLTVADVTEMPEDFQVHLSRLIRNPDDLADIAERTRRLRASGALPPKRRQSVTEMARRGARVNLDKMLRQPRNAQLSAPDVFALNDAYNANADLLAEAYQRRAVAEGTAHAERWDTAIDALEQHADAILRRYVPGASANARALGALRYAASQDLNPLQWHARARRLLGDEYTSAVGTEITRLVRSGDRTALAQYVNGLQRPLTLGDVEFYTRIVRAGFLSGGFLLRSTGRAIVGNLGRGLYERLAAPASLAWEHLLFRPMTGVRGIGRPSLAQEAAAWRGAKEGARDFVRKIRSGPGPSRLADMPTRRPLANPLLDRLVNLPYDALGAADGPFTRAARYASLTEQAEVQALEEGFRRGTAPFAARVRVIEQSPPVEAVIRAQHAALEAGAMNPTILSSGVESFRKGLERRSPLARGVSDVTATAFIRAPASVATFAAETTPLGAFATMGDALKLYRMSRGADVDVETVRTLQRLAARRAGRWTTGLAVGALVADLYRRGRITGPAPEGEKERVQFYREGHRPYALRVGRREVSLNQIQPLGGLFAFYATLEQARQEEQGGPGADRALAEDIKTYLQAAPAAMQRTGRSLIETPFFQGVRNVVELFGERAGGTPARMAGGFVPGAVRDVAKGLDPTMRVAGSPLAGVQRNVPVLSRQLPAQIDPRTGEPERVRGGNWTHVFDILGSSQVEGNEDRVLAELRAVGAVIGRPGQKARESDAAYEARARRTGRKVKAELLRVMQSARYASASREERRELLEGAVRNVRANVTRQYRSGNPWAAVGR